MRQKADFPQNPFPGSNFVPPEGPTTAKIVVIGEAPGRHENEEGRPFVGGSGKVLNGLLQSAGLSRSDIYITNVFKYQPPGNDVRCVPAQQALREWTVALLYELRALRPAVIVPMGNVALRALGYDHSITRARGAVFNANLGRIIPTYHPAYIMRQWQEYYTAERDWQKIARHAAGRAQPLPRENFNLAPTAEDVELFAANTLMRADSGMEVRVAIDLETYYIEESPLLIPIKTVGIAINEAHAIVVPFITQAGNTYWKTEDEAVRAILAIAQILEHPKITKMAHNMLFDILVLMNHGFTVAGPLFDTEIAQYLTYHPSRHALEYLVSIYTDYPPWKLEKGTSDKEFRAYNARDCIVLHLMYDALVNDVRDNGVGFIFKNLMNVIVPTCKIMLNGIHIDMDKYTRVKHRLEDDIKAMTQELRDLSHTQSFNPASTQQLATILFDVLGLKSDVKTDKGAKATGVDVLNRLSLRYPHTAFVDVMLMYRKAETQYKTFIKGLPILEDQRVHTSLSLHTAVTGRYSSSNPNLQNLPSSRDASGYIRGMYSVPEGRILVQADYSQMELMIFAVIAGDEIWLDAFAHGKDVHALNAEALIGYYDPKYRTFVKNFIYGLLYGSEGGEVERVAPRELIESISVPQMMRNLAKKHPWLFTYREQVKASIDMNHYVMNPFGRRRYYVGTPTKADIRSAINFPIQSTAADIMHMKTPEIDEALGPGDLLVLQLHDAYYIETHESRVDTVATILKSIMEEPVHTPAGHTFNLKAEVEVGASLSKNDMEKWHNGSRSNT